MEGRFEPAHVGYFFGALLLIGAMGWFISDSWDRLAGWQLTAIALIYAGLFVVAGSRVWRKSMYRVPGGLLIISTGPAELQTGTRFLIQRRKGCGASGNKTI